jgi:protease I
VARIAFMVDDMFEDTEFTEPYAKVSKAGHHAVIVGRSAGKEITGKNGAKTTVELASDEADADEFDALVIPGGYSPDMIRTDGNLVSLTQRMFAAGKPVAAICHAGWMLAEADILRGRTVTSFHSIKTDLTNAGAIWIDKEVVEDDNLITSRHPGDIPAFCDALLHQLDWR